VRLPARIRRDHLIADGADDHVVIATVAISARQVDLLVD